MDKYIYIYDEGIVIEREKKIIELDFQKRVFKISFNQIPNGNLVQTGSRDGSGPEQGQGV